MTTFRKGFIFYVSAIYSHNNVIATPRPFLQTTTYYEDAIIRKYTLHQTYFER